MSKYQDVMDKTSELEEGLAKLVSQSSLDDNTKTPLMLANAVGTIAAMHLVYMGLKPDEEVEAILLDAFKCGFRNVGKTLSGEVVSLFAEKREEDESRH